MMKILLGSCSSQLKRKQLKRTRRRRLGAPVRKQTVSRCTVSAFQWEKSALPNVPASGAIIMETMKTYPRKSSNAPLIAIGITAEAVIARRPTARKNIVNAITQGFLAHSSAIAVTAVIRRSRPAKAAVVHERSLLIALNDFK
jgi:hypothetical protein